MEVVDPGHKYKLRELDNENSVSPQFLKFVKREGEGYPGNIGHHAGTTTQEVLRILIDRTKYVDNQIPDHRNNLVLYHLRSAMFYLEARAAERHSRILPDFEFHFIELQPTCKKCGHIGCEGECH